MIQGGGTSQLWSPSLSKLSIQCFGGNHPQLLFTQPRTPRLVRFPGCHECYAPFEALEPGPAFRACLQELGERAGVDLERDDKIRDAATRVQRGTADILAYHSHLKTLLVAGCTIGVPKSEDYEELLHVREILRPPPLSRITIICALFALTEAESPHRADYASQGLRVLNSRDIVRAIELIESGREREVIDNLVSPFGHSLA